MIVHCNAWTIPVDSRRDARIHAAMLRAHGYENVHVRGEDGDRVAVEVPDAGRVAA